MGVTLLRYHIRENGLPHYPVRNDKGRVGKILVKRSEFDAWMKRCWKMDIEAIADEAIKSLKSD